MKIKYLNYIKINSLHFLLQKFPFNIKKISLFALAILLFTSCQKKEQAEEEIAELEVELDSAVVLYKADIDFATSIFENSHELKLKFVEKGDTSFESDDTVSLKFSGTRGIFHEEKDIKLDDGEAVISMDDFFASYNKNMGLTQFKPQDFPKSIKIIYEFCQGDNCIKDIIETDLSSFDSKSTLSPLKKGPEIFSINIVGNQVNLKVSSAFPAKQYVIYRGLSAGNTQELSRHAVTSNSMTNTLIDTSALQGNTYFYAVALCLDPELDICSITSSTKSIIVPVSQPQVPVVAPTIPVAPTITVTSNLDAKSATVSWPAVSGAEHYRVYKVQDTDGSFNENVYDTEYGIVHVYSNLVDNATFKYAVKACNTAGCSVYSNQVLKLTKTTITVPSIGTNLLCLYAEKNYGGESKCFNVESSFVDDFNDRTQSFVLASTVSYVTFYQHFFQNSPPGTDAYPDNYYTSNPAPGFYSDLAGVSSFKLVMKQ